MLIHGNPRAEQTEPRIRSARFGIGRDETEHRPTLLGRTEIETEHPLAPRDESEQYSISVRSVRSQAWAFPALAGSSASWFWCYGVLCSFSCSLVGIEKVSH